MILRKTAVAVAIAGIAAAPLTASAETTISGIVQVQVKGTAFGNLSDNATESIADGLDNVETTVETRDGDEEDLNIGAGDVRVNIATVHDLNSGLQGYGNIGLTLDDLLNEEGGQKPTRETADVTGPDGQIVGTVETSTGTPTVKADNVYVGIKGGFGDFRIGEVPNAIEYGQVANDIFDVAGDIGDGISYTGAFGPVTVGLDYALEAPLYGPDSNTLGAGAKVALGGFTLSGGAGQTGTDDQMSYSVGGAFAYGGASVALQYWARENADNADGTSADDTTSIGAKVGYGFGNLATNLTYEVLNDDPAIGGEGATEQAIRLDLVYDLGGGMDVSSRITSFTNDDDSSREKTEYRVMFSKAF